MSFVILEDAWIYTIKSLKQNIEFEFLYVYLQDVFVYYR